MITYLHIRARSDRATEGRLSLGDLTFRCIIGRSGRSHRKREGDGRSPIGVWALRQPWVRAGAGQRLATALALKPLQRTDGWCDAPSSGRYNRHVRLPFAESHEALWRADTAYDVVIATSHNERPRQRGAGSAIFFHLIHPGKTVTEGCVAIAAADMRKLLRLVGRDVRLVVWPGQGGPPAGCRK